MRKYDVTDKFQDVYHLDAEGYKIDDSGVLHVTVRGAATASFAVGWASIYQVPEEAAK